MCIFFVEGLIFAGIYGLQHPLMEMILDVT